MEFEGMEWSRAHTHAAEGDLQLASVIFDEDLEVDYSYSLPSPLVPPISKSLASPVIPPSLPDSLTPFSPSASLC